MWQELEGECVGRGVDLRTLSYDRFLNVVYRAMIERLDYDNDQPERPRRELDRILEVDAWYAPGTRARKTTGDRSDNAPHWWRGDEDASQSFLLSMGVVI